MKSTKSGIIRFFISFALFNFFSILVVIVLQLGFKMNLSNDSLTDLLLLNILNELFLSVILILLYKGTLLESFEKVKKDGKSKYLKNVIISGLLLFVVKIGAGIVIAIISTILGLDVTSVSNQELIENMISSAPLVMIISTVIYAPFMEELIFRQGINDVIKNKKVFIAVSGLVFGLMHVTDSVLLLTEIILLGVVMNKILNNQNSKTSKKLALSVISLALIFIIFGGIYYSLYGSLIVKLKSLDMIEVVGSISYIAMGAFLAHVYTKNDNILYSIGVHAFNNLVSMLLIL